MAGYTDAVVLEAPHFWWPAIGELSSYPLDLVQSLLASISDAPMPWPTTVTTSESAAGVLPSIRTVGLSRLGRSICLTAAWAEKEEGDTHAFLKVWSPLSADVVYLPVSTCLGRGSHSTSSGHGVDDLTSLDVQQLVREDRLRLTHRTLPASFRPSSSSSQKVFERCRRRAQRHPAYALLHRPLMQAHTAALKHLQKLAVQLTSDAGVSHSPCSSSTSLLFTGDTASQRHLLQLLQITTPPLVAVGAEHVGALLVRRLNFAEVLTLTEHEALETIEVLLRVPPTSSASNAALPPGAVRLVPCLLLILEGLHLLEAQANALVAGVTHQLCMGLEELQTSTTAATVIWAFAEDVTALPVALRSRVGQQHVRLTTATAGDRAAYFAQRVRAVHDTGMVFPSSPSWSLVCAALAEETAHWTVDRLVRLRDAELLTMCRPHTSTANAAVASPLPPPSLPQDSLNVQTGEEPVHPVYGHLYGLEAYIRKVEELVVWPLTHLSLLRDLSIPCSKGVLVCGPSGSGKTALLASLVRRLRLPDTRSVHVISIDGLALIEKEVGRSEKNIAELFDAARALAPAAVFIDNLDALAPPRGRTTSETNTTGDRTLSTLLTQMDGVGGQADRVVVVVASAPTVASLDPAVCRPGRLDVHVDLRTPPVSASADFMKRKIAQFMERVWQRVAVGKDANGAAATVSALVSELVDEYFASATASAGIDMSPAEVSAAVREVMLSVAEHIAESKKAQDDKEKTATNGRIAEMQQCLRDAFAKLVTPSR